MKYLPGSLLAVAAIGMFIAASFGQSTGVFVSLGVVFLIVAGIWLRRASTRP